MFTNVIVKQSSNNSHFTPVTVDALPLQWRTSLALHGQKGDKTFVLKDHIKLSLKDQEVSIDKAASKDIYGEKYDPSMKPPQLRKRHIRSSIPMCV